MNICFLSLDSYPVLTEQIWGYAGGAEVEQVALGRELVKLGHQVTFITYHHGGPEIEEIKGGIKVIKTYGRNQALKLSGYKKFKSIWFSLKKARADVYFHESGATGVLPYFCSIYRKKFVYRIASDAMVIGKSLNLNTGYIQQIADLLDIKKANTLVAQNEFQKCILKTRFKRNSVLIKNGVNLPPSCITKEQEPTIIWVGRITWVKQPQIFVELAKKIPYARFEIIGGKTDGESQLYEEIKLKASKIPNLNFVGFVPYHQINQYFQKALFLVNTSEIEAFPITFIQAWANNSPVVSLKVDPDNVIKNKQLGFHSGSKQRLFSDVEFLLNNNRLIETMGSNGRRYVEREHDVQQIARIYINVIESLSK